MMKKLLPLAFILIILTLIAGALPILVQSLDETPPTGFKSSFYTQGDALLFSYSNNTYFIIRDSSNGLVWNGTLQESESKRLTLAEGTYLAFASKPYTLIVGASQTQTVVGYYALDLSGKGTSTKLYTYIPQRDPLYPESKFIIFSYTNGNAVNVTDTDSKTVLWQGTLNEGQHFSQDLSNTAWQNKTVLVQSTSPVSALCYLDQGFMVPSSTGLFTGKLFYTFADNITNGNNDLNVIGFQNNTQVTISNSATKAIIWSGTLNAGEVHSEVFSKPTYLAIESNQSVTVTVDPYPTWLIMYQAALYAADADGKLIGEQFFTTARGGGYLRVIAYQDDTQVTVINQATHALVWTGMLNEMETHKITTVHTVYNVTSDKPVSVIQGYGEWSATFAPLQFTTDSDPPSISAISRTPQNPTATQSVQISADVTDSICGVQTVILSYRSGATWTDIAMTLRDGSTYEATIPAMPPQTAVDYRIIAYDSINNMAISSTQSYTVASAPTGSISINGGKLYAASPSVILDLTYSDTTSSITQVRYSNDGVWDTEQWETPSPTKSWLLTSGDGDKTVYYQIENAAGLLSQTYSDTIILDTTPPLGTISINAGAPYTSSTSVTLTMSFSDSLSGIDQIRFSNDDVWDTEPWETFISSKEWTLTSEDGEKTVYCQIKDKVGNTASYSDTITLDTSPPQGSIQINNGAAYTNTVAVDLALSATDASGISQMRFSTDSATWTAWETYNSLKSWDLQNGDGMKNVTVQFRDNLGITSSSFSDSIILDTTSPTANAGQNQTATAGTSVAFNASASADANGIVSYQWDFGDSATGTGATTSHTYSNAGTYTAKVTVQDPAGNTASATVTITVQASPNPSPTPTSLPSPSPSSSVKPTTEPETSPTPTPTTTPEPGTTSTPEPTSTTEPEKPSEQPLSLYAIVVAIIFIATSAGIFVLRRRKK